MRLTLILFALAIVAGTAAAKKCTRNTDCKRGQMCEAWKCIRVEDRAPPPERCSRPCYCDRPQDCCPGETVCDPGPR